MHEIKWSEGVRTREETRLQLPDKVLRLIGHRHRERGRNARQPSVEQPSAACARKLFMQYSMTSVGPMQSAPTFVRPNGPALPPCCLQPDTSDAAGEELVIGRQLHRH